MKNKKFKELKDRLYLGKKAQKKIKINRTILKALMKGYECVVCEVKGSPSDANRIEKRSIIGINISGVYPYYDSLGAIWKFAKPILRKEIDMNIADDVEVEIGDEVEEMSLSKLKELWKIYNYCMSIPITCKNCKYESAVTECWVKNKYKKNEPPFEWDLPPLPPEVECKK